MSDEKSKVTDKASEIAKNIWLAGVGAYGKAVEDAQGRLEKAGVEPPKLFRELVKAGTALEDEARETTVSARSSVEERINRVRENFHNQRPARIEDLQALHKKVDQLTRKVDRLAKALATRESGAGKRAAKKKPATAKKAPARNKATAGKQTTPGKKATTRRRSSGTRSKS